MSVIYTCMLAHVIWYAVDMHVMLMCTPHVEQASRFPRSKGWCASSCSR
jgi:hypothetical protein